VNLSFGDSYDFKEKLLEEVSHSANDSTKEIDNLLKKLNSVMGKICVIFQCVKVLNSCDYGFGDIEELIQRIHNKTETIEEYLSKFPEIRSKVSSFTFKNL
jgi:hypothetical protein